MLITITDDMASRSKGGRVGHPILSSSISAPGGGEFEESERRLRLVKLRRPHNGSYGFHLRGGREHGTGFFISHVEPGSEAYSQGLRSGDQVLRVNQFSVSRALHKEVTSLVQAGNEVVLEVKSSGLIPVKNNPNDPLSWVLVEGERGRDGAPSELGTSSSLECSDSFNFNSGMSPVQIIVGGAGKYTIGCSICKGPAEKPGIFVQRVREGGMADTSGLRAGDQIVSCNGVSFYCIEFQQAVQAMKSSPCLRLEVLRGAGLDLVMGESSGYNSSASSETGEEPFSESDSRDAFPHSLASTLQRKLNCMRYKVQLDSNRDWKEIEAEWEDAEVSVKRAQLKNNHHTLLSRPVNSGGNTSTMSKSFVNLTINEEETDTSRLSFDDASSATTHFSSASSRLSTLSKPRSMIDLRSGHGSSYKIAMQTASDAHVSKIVIPSAPKDEQNALLRLEELSSGQKISSSHDFSHLPTPSNHSKTCSISSTSSEEFTNSANNNFSNHARNLSLMDNRQLIRCKSVPQDCNFVSSEDSDSVLSYPSSTVSVTSMGSGRYTSKILIRNNPPPPPPRANNTKLTRHHRKVRGTHHRNQPKVIPSTQSACLDHSPSTSPCTSSGSSADTNFQSCSHSLRHTTSFGSLSASSDESVGVWEESTLRRGSGITTISHTAIQSPTQRLQDMVNSHQKVGVSRTLKRTPLTSTKTVSAVPPPPPPPPPPVPHNSSLIPPPPPMPQLLVPSSSEQCDVLSRQQEISGAVGKLRSAKDRPNEILKEKPFDPKKMQHEQLMEEFKRAHAKMVAKRQPSTLEESNETSH